MLSAAEWAIRYPQLTHIDIDKKDNPVVHKIPIVGLNLIGQGPAQDPLIKRQEEIIA